MSTLYAGAQLFSPDRLARIGRAALEALQRYDPEGEFLGPATHRFVEQKLRREPVEDFRIDFEDGFGLRSDEEEDRFALAAARALHEAPLPRRIGLRVRSLGPSWGGRALRTLSLFLNAAGPLPPGFRLTLPKVEHPRQVRVIRRALDLLGVELELELMAESPAALAQVPAWLQEARGSCRAIHFGPNDFLASCGILVGELHHPLCQAARQQLLFACAGTGLALADGPTTRLPIATRRELAADTALVRAAWARHRADLRQSWSEGYTQSWDLHPAQLVSHYAEVHDLFHELEPGYRARLQSFQRSDQQAVQTLSHFDDQATIRILENFFQRGQQLSALADPTWSGLPAAHPARGPGDGSAG